MSVLASNTKKHIPCYRLEQEAIIDSSCTSGTSTLETYFSNVIARQLYAQKCLKYRKVKSNFPVGEPECGQVDA